MSAKEYIDDLVAICHARNNKWWVSLEDGVTPIKRNVGELLMLCVSELAEAMEADRKNLNDDKLCHRPGLEVELADCLIRIFDLAGGLNIDLGGAFAEKMSYNATRKDHTLEHRRGENGKRY